MRRRHQRSTLFPYTTLFRSHGLVRVVGGDLHQRDLRRRVERPVVAGVGHLRSEEHTSELQSLRHLVCRLLLEKKKRKLRSSVIRLRDLMTVNRLSTSSWSWL